MSLFRRKPRVPAVPNGTLIVDATLEHRCKPPGCHEWPAAHWKIDNTKRYPEGCVWLCNCGKAWIVSRWEPGHIGMFNRGSGLWTEWWRSREHDE